MSTIGSAATVVTCISGSSIKSLMPVIKGHSSRVAVTNGVDTVGLGPTEDTNTMFFVTFASMTTRRRLSTTSNVSATATEIKSSTLSHKAGTGSLLLVDQAVGGSPNVGDSLLGMPMVLGGMEHHPGWLSIPETIGLCFGILHTHGKKQELTGSRQQQGTYIIEKPDVGIDSQLAGGFLPGMLMVQYETVLRHVLLCMLGTIG